MGIRLPPYLCMHVSSSVNCALESGGNTFSAEGEFSGRSKCFYLVPFSECHLPLIMIPSIHNFAFRISLTILEEENRSPKNALCYSDVKIYNTILVLLWLTEPGTLDSCSLQYWSFWSNAFIA